MMYLIVGIIVVYFILAQKKPPETYSNWNLYLEGLQYSSDEYYKELEKILQSKNVAGIGYKRVMIQKGGFLSSQREYLRITFEDVTHDISFYPFAKGTYASSWSYITITGLEEILSQIRVIGTYLINHFYPKTYYVADSVAMFQLLVHEAQLEIIDGLTKQKGLRKLSEAERQLKTKGIFDRK